MSGTDDQATFGFALETTDAERGAASLGDALEKLDTQLVEDTQHVAAMQKALRNLKGGGAESVQLFKEMKARIDAKKVSIAQAQSKYIELGGNFKKIKKPADDVTKGLDGLGKAAKGVKAPASEAAGGLGSLLKNLRAAPWFAAAAAVVTFAAGLVTATAAVLAFGLEAANAYRNEKLMLDGLVAMPNWFGRAAGKADELQTAIGRIAANNPLARAEIAGLTDELYRAGLRGKGLETALEGVAIAQAGGGPQAKAYYQALVVGAGRSSAAIKKFADDAKARFGGIVSRKMLDLNVQMAKFKENVNGLFSGFKIESVLKGLQSVTELFSQNTSTGRALKTILEAMFQPMIDGLATVGPIAKRFFQGLTIGALDFTIAILRVRLWLKRTFGGNDILRGIDMQNAAVTVGVVVFGMLAGAALACGAALLFAATVAALPFIALAGMILIPWAAFKAFKKGVEAVGEQLKAMSWESIGRNLVEGFVKGIMLGIPAVGTAVANLGATAAAALRKALDSHSPSRLFARIAFTAPQGAVVAFKAGRRDVAKASADLGKASAEGFDEEIGAPTLKLGMPSTPAGSSGSAPARTTNNSETRAPVQVTIQYNGTPDKSARTQVEEMRQLILSEFVGVGIAVGANLGATP